MRRRKFTLNAAIARSDLSLTEICREVGCTTASLWLWRRGAIPGGEHMMKLARVLSLSVDSIKWGSKGQVGRGSAGGVDRSP